MEVKRFSKSINGKSNLKESFQEIKGKQKKSKVNVVICG